MTINHILIRSAVLGISLFASAQVQAEAKAPIDPVLVAYFDKIYSTKSPKCAVSDANKTLFVKEQEQKCLNRTSQTDTKNVVSQVISSTYKKDCSELIVKSAIDSRIDTLCRPAANQSSAAVVNVPVAGTPAEKPADARNRSGSSQTAGAVAGAPQGSSQVAPSQISTATNAINRQSTQPTAQSTHEADGSGGTKSNGKPESKKSSLSASVTTLPKLEPPVYVYTSSDGKITVEVTSGPDGETLVKKNSEGKIIGNVEKVASGEKLTEKLDNLGVNSAQATVKLDSTFNKVEEKLTKDTKEIGTKTLNGKIETVKDDLLSKREEASKAEDKKLDDEITKIETELNRFRTLVPQEANTKCTSPDPAIQAMCPLVQEKINCLSKHLEKIKAAKAKLAPEKTACSTTSASAEKLCSMVRSEKAQQVQQLMTVGLGVLSKVTAASESCGITSTLSKVAQGGMLIAQGACSMKKAACDMSCNSAQKTLAAMKTEVQGILSCGLTTLEPIRDNGGQVEKAAYQLGAVLDEELTPEKSVPSSIAQCDKHKLDVAQMGLTALGFLSAAQDGQKCQEQLATGNSGTGTSTSSVAGATMTTAEYCAVPDNAATITCKCTANPNAEGCLGSGLAKSGVALGKINGTDGPSAFASAGQNGLGSLTASGLNKDKSAAASGTGLSAAAREALGLGGTGGSAGVGNASGGGGSSSQLADEGKDKASGKDEKKFGFFSTLGGMLSGGKKSNQDSKSSNRTYEQDEAIKRKIASEKVRAEITTASGKTNFDKIRSAYQSNSNSFEQ